LAVVVGISQFTVFHIIKDMNRVQKIALLLTSIQKGTTMKEMLSYAILLPLTKPGYRHTSLN
jgi:hypothetical protein